MGRPRSRRLLVLVTFTALTFTLLVPAVARAQGNGVPFAELRRQIEALSQRVADLEAAAVSALELTVNCGAGQTIGEALREPAGALTITVVGRCNENVAIHRNDVRLIGGSGAEIHGPDTTADTVTVTGDRFVLDGITVTGGRNGISVQGGGRATLRNCSTRAAGAGIVAGIGIVFFQGANGSIDRCVSTGNPNDGALIDAGTATITNSDFSSNGRAGVLMLNGSNVRFGLNNAFGVEGNTIRNNGSNGVHLTLNSFGLFVGNTISGNGANPAAPLGRVGIFVYHARANLGGSNTITGNGTTGLSIVGSTAAIGDAGFGVPTANTISGNGTNGLSVTLGSAVSFLNATIQNNAGHGIAGSQRAILSVSSSTITGNAMNGVRLSQASAATFQIFGALGPSTITGNGAGDLNCLDGESSFEGVPPGATAGIGTITCTGF